MLKVLAVIVAMLLVTTTAYAQEGQYNDNEVTEDTLNVKVDTLDNGNDIYIDEDDGENGEDGNGNGNGRENQVIVQQNQTPRYEQDKPLFQSWGGFGVHGGPVSGLSNDALENSINDAYGEITDFNFDSEMTNLGVHFAGNSAKFIGFIAAFDYTWKDQNVIGGVDLTTSIISLTGDVNLVVPFVVSPFVGAGIGGYRTAQSIDADSVAVILPDNKINFGWNVRGGLGLDITDFVLRPFVEWRYHRIETSDPISYHAINFGVTFKFQ